jgi:hypothetical protein
MAALKVKPVMWNLEQALDVVRSIQDVIREYGFHVCLGGGVLNTGESRKDLDLYFLRLTVEDAESDPPALLAFLRIMWNDEGESLGNEYPDVRFHSKYKFMLDSGQRIDIFIQ